MEFFTQRDAPLSARDGVCRHAPSGDVLGMALLVPALAWLVKTALAGGIQTAKVHFPPSVAWTVAGVVGLILLLVLGDFRARLRPANWRLRITPDGLLVNLRSYLNAHLPAGDVTVARIAWHEIEWARGRREKQLRREHRNGHTTTVITWHTDLELSVSTDLAELAGHLAAERTRRAPMVKRWWGGRSGVKHNDYPVRATPDGTVRVAWNGVRPGIKGVVERLRSRVATRPLERATVDLRDPGTLSPEQREEMILLLVDRGKSREAAGLAADLYGMSRPEAGRFVDELNGLPPRPEVTLEQLPHVPEARQREVLMALAGRGELMALRKAIHALYGLGWREVIRFTDGLYDIEDADEARRYLEAFCDAHTREGGRR